MKHYLFTLLLLLIVISSCKRTITSGSQLIYVKEEISSGEITLEVSANDENLKTVIADKGILEELASKKAFEQLLFIGVPNSLNYRLPMIPNSPNLTSSTSFIKSFFEEKAYRSFISNMNLISSKERAYNGKNSQRYRITINGSAFRKYLEANNALPSFGY